MLIATKIGIKLNRLQGSTIHTEKSEQQVIQELQISEKDNMKPGLWDLGKKKPKVRKQTGQSP